MKNISLWLLALLFPVAGHAERECLLRDLSASAFRGGAMERAMAGEWSSLYAMPVTRSLQLEDAPLNAIGKLTVSNDPSEPPSCTALLIMPNVIITANRCVAESGKRARYFFPGSSAHSSRPHGSAVVQNWWFNTGTDFAIARLDRSFPNVPVLGIQTSGGSFPSSWQNRATWFISGYTTNGSLTPTLRSGCAVTQVDAADLHHNCTDDYLDGAAIFARLCGRWHSVAILTRRASGYLLRTDRFWETVEKAGADWGFGFEQLASCSTPDSVEPQARFMDDDLPGRYLGRDFLWGTGLIRGAREGSWGDPPSEVDRR